MLRDEVPRVENSDNGNGDLMILNRIIARELLIFPFLKDFYTFILEEKFMRGRVALRSSSDFNWTDRLK